MCQTATSGCSFVSSSASMFGGASGHSKNCRRCVGIFLKEHHPSVIVFENMDPVLLYGFACSLCPNGRRTDNHYGVTLLNHFTRRKFGKIQILSHSREEICNFLLTLEITCPRQFVLGASGYRGGAHAPLPATQPLQFNYAAYQRLLSSSSTPQPTCLARGLSLLRRSR